MKTEALVSFAVTAKLICPFVYAYEDFWFSHAAAQLKKYFFRQLIHKFLLAVSISKLMYIMSYMIKFCFTAKKENGTLQGRSV